MMFIRFLIVSMILFSPCTMGATLTLQVKKPNHSLVFRENKTFTEFHPNASLHWGIKLSGEAFYIEYGQKIKNSNFNNSNIGNDSYKDYRVGIYWDNFFYEVFYKEYKGFSSNESDSCQGRHACHDRPDLVSQEINFLALMALEKKFSMKALTSSGVSGANSSGSVILSFFLNRLKIHDKNGIIQDDQVLDSPDFASFNELDLRQGGIGIGYGVIMPFYSIFYAGLYGGIGAGLQQNTTVSSTGSDKMSGISGQWGLRMNLGTQKLPINFGIKGLLFSNFYDLGSNKNVASVNYSLYVYLALIF